MGAHHPFGFTGGARGEQQIAQVIGTDPGCPLPGVGFTDACPAGQKLIPRRGVTQQHQPLEGIRTMGGE